MRGIRHSIKTHLLSLHVYVLDKRSGCYRRTRSSSVSDRYLIKFTSYSNSYSGILDLECTSQETSCQNFFSSLLYVRELFFGTIVLCRNFFLREMHLQDIFFKTTQSPPPSEVKWLASKNSKAIPEPVFHIRVKISSPSTLLTAKVVHTAVTAVLINK